MTLHEAMVKVLQKHGGGWMTYEKIAQGIADSDLYRQKGGSHPPAHQIRMRACLSDGRYQEGGQTPLFECDSDRGRVRLLPGVARR